MFGDRKLLVCVEVLSSYNADGEDVSSFVTKLPKINHVYEFDGCFDDDPEYIHLVGFNESCEVRGGKIERVSFYHLSFRPLTEVGQELTQELVNNIEKDLVRELQTF